MLRVRPGQFGKFLDGDPTRTILVLEAALVDDIGGFVAALGDDEVGAEVIGGVFQVGQRELRESQYGSGGLGSVGGLRSLVVVGGSSVAVVQVLVLTSTYKQRLTAPHNSAELTQ